MSIIKEIVEDRIFKGYLLDEWGTNKIDGVYQLGCHPCDLCELTEECDRLADDLNHIEYCMCLSKGIIKDTEFKKNHPDAYFKYYKK